MGHTLRLAALGAVAYMVLDGVWLGLLMKNFYRLTLADVAWGAVASAACGAVVRSVAR